MEQEIVDKINRSSMKLSMVVTGGGSRFIGDFLSHSGGSNTILDFQVPYSEVAHEAYLQKDVDYKFVSEEAAYELAKAAYRKMQHCTGGDLLGVSVTASLIKDNEREGRDNHFYMGIADKDFVYVYHVKIDKSSFTWRLAQEVFVSDTILKILNDREVYPYKKVFREKIDWSNLPMIMDLKAPVCFFIGSFNPWHDGHQAIFDNLRLKFNNVLIEISQHNRDKESVSKVQLIRRITNASYRPLGNYIITEKKYIIDKIRYFKTLGFENINIAMGLDTWDRFISDHPDAKNDELFSDVTFTVYNRGATKFDCGGWGYAVEFIKGFDIGISSTQIRERKALTEQQKTI